MSTDEQNIRMQCLELATRCGSKNPIETAGEFLSFVTGASTIESQCSDEIREAINRTCDELGASVEQVLSARRTASVVKQRDAVIAAVYREHPHVSLPELGRAFNRDHTSILASVRRSGAWEPRIAAVQ